MLVMVVAGGVAMQAVALALIAAGLPVVRAADVPMALRIVAQVPIGLIVTGGTGAGLAPVCERSGCRVIVVGGGCDPGLLPYLLAALAEGCAPGMVVDLARASAPEPVAPWQPVAEDEGIPDWADLVAELRAAVAKGGVPVMQAKALPMESADFEEWEPFGVMAAVPVAPIPEVAAPRSEPSLLAQTRVRRFAIVA